MKNLFRRIKNEWLCIRYPFLREHHRFTDRLYTNWKIENELLRLDYMSDVRVRLKFVKEELKDTTRCLRFLGHSYCLEYPFRGDITYMVVRENLDVRLRLNTSDILSKGNILQVGFEKLDHQTPRIVIRISEDAEFNEEFSQFRTYTLDTHKWYKFQAKVLRKYYSIIGWFASRFPRFTELDALEPGWRKAFGNKIIKEIKRELKKYNLLHKYRIMQIKEKFGSLRWYDAYSPKEVFDIIQKYENISMQICQRCGKPATKQTTRWIGYYCDDCAPDTAIDYEPRRNNQI